MGRPRKHDPEVSPSERVRLSRARRREAGEIAASVQISAETVAALARVTAATGETRQAAVARLAREADERL